MWKNRRSIPALGKLLLALFALSSFWINSEVMAQAVPRMHELPLVTNIFQLRNAVSGNMGSLCRFSLEGTILAVDSRSGMVFFQDGSGTEILEISLEGQPLRPGQRVQLRGTNYVISTETGVSLGRRPVVDSDGLHGEVECTGTVYLKAGRHPIQLLWFNYVGNGILDLAYAGPSFARRPIPNTVLFRSDMASADGSVRDVNGLNYCCFEGQWQKLPSFKALQPVKTGVVSNFDKNVRTKGDYVGLTFDGFIDVDKDGLYTFYLRSDDGSQLFINNTPTQVTVTGVEGLPAPKRVAIRQPLSRGQGAFWAEVEGTVTFLGRQQNGAELELTSEDTHMRLAVCDGPEEPPRYLLGARVRVRGVCLDTSNTEEQRLTDALVVPSWNHVQVIENTPELWSLGRSLSISDCKLLTNQNAASVVRLRGKLLSTSPEKLPNLDDGTGSVPIELLDLVPQLNGEVECIGRWSQTGSNSVLRQALWRELPKNQDNKTNALPVLTTAAQVQRLKRDQAQRGYKAKIRGVVIWLSENRDCVVLQDSTRGVFVGLRKNWIWDTPRVGEILEVEGSCVAAEFSPIVILNKGVNLGVGRMPAPMHPTWDQLIAGSMDSQYVEIRGFVTGIRENRLVLLMPGGKVDVEFHPSPAGALDSFINSVVRIRGCLFAKWDFTTGQVTVDHPLWFGSATICVDTPPALDPFSANKLRARELMQYDVQGNLFRRVKISGQVLHAESGLCSMTDEGFGLRFQPVQPVDFEPGDNVDVVGLVELGGVSPVLREAIVRKTGHSPLPAPRALTFDRTNGTYDASLVCVEGLLVGSRDVGYKRVLEMQIGVKSFVARLTTKDLNPVVLWPTGSRLKLTGVYSDLGGNQQGRHDVNSFELLLNSPADIQLVERPPWWTLNRLLTMVAFLACGLALAFIWIRLLRGQVKRRTVQLEREIGERERAEQGRAIEQERSRIARDLHDDLGSRLTAISMLAVTGRGVKLASDASNERLQLIADRSRSMVTALDELVWAVNPKNDTVAALAEYLASFAEELLARTEITYHVELPLDYPKQNIAAEARHNVLLSVGEALNNAVRHGQPSEVLLQLSLLGGELQILVKDNGCGFDPAAITRGNGLANFQERMRKVNGRCQIQSVPGSGTTVFLTLPL